MYRLNESWPVLFPWCLGDLFNLLPNNLTHQLYFCAVPCYSVRQCESVVSPRLAKLRFPVYLADANIQLTVSTSQHCGAPGRFSL